MSVKHLLTLKLKLGIYTPNDLYCLKYAWKPSESLFLAKDAIPNVHASVIDTLGDLVLVKNYRMD